MKLVWVWLLSFSTMQLRFMYTNARIHGSCCGVAGRSAAVGCHSFIELLLSRRTSEFAPAFSSYQTGCCGYRFLYNHVSISVGYISTTGIAAFEIFPPSSLVSAFDYNVRVVSFGLSWFDFTDLVYMYSSPDLWSFEALFLHLFFFFFLPNISLLLRTLVM